MMKSTLPLLLCIGLAACGQQNQPETTAEQAPSTSGTPASTAPTAPAQQVGMSPAIQAGGAGNPTGRGERGDAGRGQGPAPGQTGSSAPAPAVIDETTPDEARSDCERLADPERQQCLDSLSHGEAIDAKREANDGG